MTEQQPPLWETMRDAYLKEQDPESTETANSFRRGLAAEIRAIADRLVPKKSRPNKPAFPDADYYVADGVWLCHQKIRQRLLAEADYAEVGDD